MRKFILPILILTFGLFFNDASTQNVFPGEEWSHHECKHISGISDFIIDSMNTTGIVVIQEGKIVYQFGDIIELSYLASCRKSVLAMLYGKYVENGTINLNSSLEELGIDDNLGLLPIEKKATIDHLITARSGIYHPASNAGDNTADAPERGSQEPGTYMLYNNWDFNAAGAIFEQLTQKNIYDAIESDLAIPIQMQDWDRTAQRKSGNTNRSKNLAYHMWFSTRDMARIGYLMLNEGNWNGKQVISKAWAKKISSTVTPLEEMNPKRMRQGPWAYGYMWWTFDNPNQNPLLDGAYTAAGYYGQYITVIPNLDMVIAHKTKAAYRRGTTNYLDLVNLIVENAEEQRPNIKQQKSFDKQLYTGTYDNREAGYSFDVFLDRDQLIVKVSGNTLELLPCSLHNYTVSGDDHIMVEFLLNDIQEVVGATVDDGESTYFTKIKK